MNGVDKLLGYQCSLNEQQTLLIAMLCRSKVLKQVLDQAQALGLTDYYVGAGCICQTVWNDQNGLDLLYGISDVDFVYFDRDISYEKEDGIIRQIKETFADLPVSIDVKNQARVHLWYEKHFGKKITPYASLESAIDTWPTTATAIGVRKTPDGWHIYAPFGLNDLFGQIVRANKTLISQEIYEQKCEKWKAKWPFLTITVW